jgi:hypothetical protein
MRQRKRRTISPQQKLLSYYAMNAPMGNLIQSPVSSESLFTNDQIEEKINEELKKSKPDLHNLSIWNRHTFSSTNIPYKTLPLRLTHHFSLVNQYCKLIVETFTIYIFSFVDF